MKFELVFNFWKWWKQYKFFFNFSLLSSLHRNRDEKIAKTKDFDGLQEKEEEREDEEWKSEITAAVEDKVEDAKNIGSNQNQDNYQNHLTGNNLKPLTVRWN